MHAGEECCATIDITFVANFHPAVAVGGGVKRYGCVCGCASLGDVSAGAP